MPVDLTLADTGGKLFWLEAKLADNGDVGKTFAAANKDLKGYRKAAAAPQDWKLDDYLSGQAMVAPSGFGTLTCSTDELLLLVDGFDNCQLTFNRTPAAPRSRYLETHSRASGSWRTRKTRKLNRQLLQRSTTRGLAPVLEKLRCSKTQVACKMY